jgi:hypothetical protein
VMSNLFLSECLVVSVVASVDLLSFEPCVRVPSESAVNV